MTFARSQNCGLDKWRYDDGSPRQTDNVYRCPHHNDSLGGVKQSRHMYRDAADLQSVKENEAEYNAMHAAATRANAHHIEPLADSCGLECIHADRRDYTGAYSTATRGPSAGDQVQLRPAIVKELSSSDQRVRKCAFYRLLGASGNQSRADLRDLRMVNLPVGVIETNAMASQGQTALGTIAVPRGAALLDDASSSSPGSSHHSRPFGCDTCRSCGQGVNNARPGGAQCWQRYQFGRSQGRRDRAEPTASLNRLRAQI
jgi:hypothetical protein